jgi:hypothetical protein
VWPYDDPVNTLALTTVTYGIDDARIYEIYTEVNSAQHELTTAEPPPANGAGFDLQSILTHEAGHFLGIAHATDTNAIMYAYYQPGAINLTADDIDAICTAVNARVRSDRRVSGRGQRDVTHERASIGHVRFRLPHAAGASIGVAGLIVACGARTGLFGMTDESPARDAQAEPAAQCSSGTYCDPSDPVHIYQCGQAIVACGLLEQCTERSAGAECVNPCVDSLGNNTSNGCDFYAVELDSTPDTVGACYAVFVVNQWKTGEPARLQVMLGNNVLPIEQFARIPSGAGTAITYGPFNAETGLPTNQIAILFLSRDPSDVPGPRFRPVDPGVLANCPPGVTPAVSGDAALHGTGIGAAFHIQTNVPVVAYQMLPFGGGHARVTGATLLLPTSAWDTNYLVADAYQAPSPVLVPGARAGPTTAVVAREDATTITLKPTVDVIAAGSLAGTPAHVPVTYTLNQGQYLQFTQRAELTGSALQADKPIGVFGGATLMDVPVTTFRGDTAEQMLPPVRALANEYVAVRYRNRGSFEEVVPWRIVGAVDGTELTYDPLQPGAPSTINAGNWVEFDEPGPFVVRSQDSEHPFYLAAYMTGGCGTPATQTMTCPTPSDGPLKGFGDPEFLNVISPAQYLPRYTFFTDPTYPETNLVVVRVRDPQTTQMPDVTLDCAGLLGGWQPVGSSATFEMTRVDLSTGDFQGSGNCNNGVHTITATLPGATGSPPPTPLIGVTIWGWGNDITWPTDNLGSGDEENPNFTRWVSYGYPAGANFKPLNTTILTAQ